VNVTTTTRLPAVPFVALDRLHRTIAPELTAAFERVLASSAFVLGEEVAAFEHEWATYCGTRHCVGVASGTAALSIALSAAGVGPGDEVVVPAHTFVATALAVVQAGATPVFCDVDAGTGLIDPASAAAVVTERTAAIIGVHLYGQAFDVEAVRALSAARGLLLVEDAAQAHGALRGQRRAGGLADVAAFSFYPSKNLGALGDGGAICTDDDALAERARMLRNLGQRRKGEHVVVGGNERLDGLQAAVLRAKLPHLDQWNAARRRHAALYREHLHGVDLLAEDDEGVPVHHLLPVRSRRRDALRAALSDEEIHTGVHYDPAVHRQPALARFAPRDRELPEADRWAAEVLTLPMDPTLTTEEILRAALTVSAYAASLQEGRTPGLP